MVAWVALVGVYEYEDDRNRKGNPLISAKAKGWIADPVVGFVYEPVVASGSSATLLNLIGAIWKEPPDFLSSTDDWREARERCMNSLTEQVLRTVQNSAVDAYDLELPDHSIISRFRSRLGLEKFQQIFNEIITEAREAGLVSDRLRIIDAAHLQAKADLFRLPWPCPRKRVQV